MTLAPRPKRITPPAAPGELLKQFLSPPRRHIAETDNAAGYLEKIRDLPCLKCGMEPCEAAHVRFASAAYGKSSGLGKKPDDKWALSLCASCHRLSRDAQHNRGEQQFWNDLGINPLIVCEQLWAQRGDIVAMRAVVMVAIANRGKQ